MMMQGEHKITAEHLARRAVVYLRQSSEGQVKNNVESQRLQYAMAERATKLGFGRVEVVDADLGSSAAMASTRREGFERLLGAVALGEVGVILSREVSRLSRNDQDFCRLLEVCQLFGTLIGDEDALYDVRRADDQLVLGIKGTMSVVELNVLRMRLAQGKENKARRGEIYPRLPPGYVWDGGKVVKDPNLRVQDAMGLVFTKFRETWSIRQTFTAEHLGVGPRTLRLAAERSHVSAEHPLADGPWVFERAALDAPDVLARFAHLPNARQGAAVPSAQQLSIVIPTT